MKKGNRFVDISNQRFGRLLALEVCGISPFKQIVWECLCDCGKKRNFPGTSLRSGRATSCGCLFREKMSHYAKITKNGTKHGGRRTRLYTIWKNMRRRCQYKKQTGFKHYGGRGISVFKAWEDFSVFRDWALKAGYKDDLTIDRKNNNGNYEPLNCQWITLSENSKKSNAERKH